MTIGCFVAFIGLAFISPSQPATDAGPPPSVESQTGKVDSPVQSGDPTGQPLAIPQSAAGGKNHGDPGALRVPIPPDPTADCNGNGISDAIDLTPILLPAPPSQMLVDGGISAQSDRRSNIRCDDFILLANTTVVALDVDGRGGNPTGDTFKVRFWSAYSITDADGDGVLDPGSFHPLAVEYSEDVPAGRVTRTSIDGTVFRWNIKLATPVLLTGNPSAGGTTHFLEVFYTGSASNFWSWERNAAPPVGSPVHVTQQRPETWWNQVGGSEMNGLRFQLYTAHSVDANNNGVPDECEDCNGNGIPDSQESSVPDCNTNGIKDTCEIAMSLAADCNSNGVPDGCESGDCDTNGVNDRCDIAAGALDCNTNGIPDFCEIQGLTAPAFQQMAGTWTASGFSSDNFIAGMGFIARSDDFQLATTRKLGGVSAMGFFLNGAGGNGTTDTFTVRIWTNASGRPGTIEYTENIPASRVTRTSYMGNFFPGVTWQYSLRFVKPVIVSAGTHWLELFYTGPAAGDFYWAFLEPTAGSPINTSRNTPGEEWSPLSNAARLFMTGYVAATDCNTNGTPDACELPGHDSNGNGVLDSCEDCNTNGIPDPSEAGYRDCNSNGRLDACDILPGGSSLNCNTNGTPDECELPDCNTNSVPDACDLLTQDCNTDHTVDACGQDCNTNGSADACDIAAGGGDCNTNRTLDVCGEDCNTNGIADICDLNAGGGNADCNTNHTLDACEADCDTNGTPDGCDLARGQPDCNSNRLLDACEISGTVLVAVDESTGPSTGLGFYSDLRRNQVLCDDFTLTAARTITGVRVTGFFGAPGAGSVSDDSFIVRIWSDASGTPGSVVHTETVSGAALSRSGGFTHTLTLTPAVPLQPGTYWVEAAYNGNAPGPWNWAELTPRLGNFAQLSSATFPEHWSSVARGSHWNFQILFGSPDADSNGVPDECAACSGCAGDLNGDGRIDGADVQAFVSILLTGHSAGSQTACADIDQDGVVDTEDLQLFTAMLTVSDGNCPTRVMLDLNAGGGSACQYQLVYSRGTMIPPGWITGSIQCIACTASSPSGGNCPGPFIYYRFVNGDCSGIAVRVISGSCSTNCTGAAVAKFSP